MSIILKYLKFSKRIHYQAAKAVPFKKSIKKLDSSFNNHEEAFKSKSTSELFRALLVYQLCSFSILVDNNMVLLKLGKTILREKAFNKLMKATFYGHFVGGEDIDKVVTLLERLRQYGVKAILDYSVEEDLSQEEAEKLELESSVSEMGDVIDENSLKQFHPNKQFADRRKKVDCARTYFYINEPNCDRNMEVFINCIEKVANFGSGITAIKMTALGRPQMLLQISEVIMRARKYMEELAGGHGNVLTHHKTTEDLERYYVHKVGPNEDVKEFLKRVSADNEGIINIFPWSGLVDEDSQLSETFRIADPTTGRMRRLISQITPKEEAMFRNMIHRLNTIVKAASDLGGRVMVDAEQTYFQPAISRLTIEMMRKHNLRAPIVYNTYQNYLKDSYEEILADLEQAKRQGFYFGAKLVRGAYMDQERARAVEMGYEDPINPTYEATTRMYNRTLAECLKRIKYTKECCIDPQRITIMVASHNEDTIRFAIEEMADIGILPEDNVICFGQLLGMCDHITFPLGQSGYEAYKYIPYGPVDKVLPYISRRAFENKQVLGKVRKEKQLLKTEIIRRFKSGQLGHK